MFSNLDQRASKALEYSMNIFLILFGENFTRERREKDFAED